MIIDAHAHSAGEYVNAEASLSTSKKYAIDRILLCPSPKNIQDLKKPPNLP